MIVYIEDTILVNFLLNLIILFLTSKICFIKNKWYFLFIAALLGSILAIFYPLLNLSVICLTFVKFLISLLMIIIAFKFITIKKFIFEMLVFYGNTALFGGVLVAININFNIENNTISFVLFISIIIFFISNMLINTYLKKKAHNSFLYKAKIKDGDNEIEIMAFLDSGNNIKNKDGRPIFVITTDLFIKLFGFEKVIKIYAGNLDYLKDATYIKIGTVASSNSMLTFVVDYVFIQDKTHTIELKNVCLGISRANLKKSFGCDMLLHPEIIKEFL